MINKEKCLQFSLSLVIVFLSLGRINAQYQHSGNYSIGGNLGIGVGNPAFGLEVNKRTVKYSNQHAVYRWRWGGGTDLEWKKVAVIQLANLLYRSASLEVEIFNTGSNHGYSVLGQKLLFFISARRSGAKLNDRDIGILSGPVADYVRLVKLEIGKFELQVRQVEHWREMEVRVKQTGGFDSPVTYTENPINGSTTGIIYMPEPSHTHYFTKGRFAGNVGIGTSPSDEYALTTNGAIRATEIKVEAQTADFVFEPDYALRPLKEVEAFVKENKHLPEIPSAKQMEADGVNVAEMNKLLLQKVEELTLYLLKEHETNKKQELIIQRQQELLNQLLIQNHQQE